MMMSNSPMNYSQMGDGEAMNSVDDGGSEARLDQLFVAYREAMPDPDASVNFMPELWARIEERERSSNWFGRLAKGLVTAAVAAYLIIAMVSASTPRSTAYYFNGTFVEALVADNISSLDSLHLDRISQLEMERQ
jgi:hypothetical protein